MRESNSMNHKFLKIDEQRSYDLVLLQWAERIIGLRTFNEFSSTHSPVHSISALVNLSKSETFLISVTIIGQIDTGCRPLVAL